MWTIDAQCSRCTHRTTPQHAPATPCGDRAVLVTALQNLTSELNALPLVDGPGDGILIISCKDFAVA
jgi:hypothetical protein